MRLSVALSVTRVPGVRAYTVTVVPDATATTRSRAILLRLRLIAAAKLVAFVVVVLDVWKLSPVFELADEVKVSVTAAPPLGVMVMAAVLPAAGWPVNVPVTLARAFPVVALMGNTTKSELQLGAAFALKLYLAGAIPGATPPAPSEMAQSFLISLREDLGGPIGLSRRPEPVDSFCNRPGSPGRLCNSPESCGAFPCRSHCAYARGSCRVFADNSLTRLSVNTTCFVLQSSGTGREPSGLAKSCANTVVVKLAASNRDVHLEMENTFNLPRSKGADLNLFNVRSP